MFYDKDYNSENNTSDENNSVLDSDNDPKNVSEAPLSNQIDASDEKNILNQESVMKEASSEKGEISEENPSLDNDVSTDEMPPSEQNGISDKETAKESNSDLSSSFDLGGNGSIYRDYSVYNNIPQPQYTEDSFNKVVSPPKKGKAVFWIVLVVMMILSMFATAVLTRYFSNGNGSTEDGLPSHEYTQTVIEHVKIEKPENEAYTDKTKLYEKAQESCVTVICGMKGGYYGQTSGYSSLGSGFVVSKDGYIVTNAHVVEGANSIKIRFYDGTEKEALLIGKDSICDIAVVKIHRSDDLVPVSFGDSSSVRIGEFAMAIGTPSNDDLFGTMTFGVISGKERKISIKNTEGQTVKTMLLLQTDATLNPGNSGGPLFNMNGQVIGINTMKLTETFEGVGFAIPSSGAVNVINSLISTGESNYSDSNYVKMGSQLGITGVTMSDSVEKEYGFADDSPKGVLVVTIDKEASAYKAGLSTYDVICEFNEEEITTIEQLIGEIQECSPGDKVTVKVYRVERNGKDGKYHTYTFALDAVEG